MLEFFVGLEVNIPESLSQGDTCN